MLIYDIKPHPTDIKNPDISYNLKFVDYTNHSWIYEFITKSKIIDLSKNIIDPSNIEEVVKNTVKRLEENIDKQPDFIQFWSKKTEKAFLKRFKDGKIGIGDILSK